MQITTIGLDIAKNVFQVHGIDVAERVVVRKQLRRRQLVEFFKALPPCLVGMEACATAHYWARELMKLGHLVRLMPAKDVKAYVKRNKNDAADAEAICEAVRRPTMRFVQIKSAEQQGRLMLHRARDLLMRQRTQVINALRAHLAEFGIVAPQGRQGVKELLLIIAGGEDERLPVDAHASLVVLSAEFTAMQTMIGSIEKRILVLHRSNEASRRLETIPGIGIAGATAIAATVPDPTVFRSGRDFAAWIGLVPREDSTGGKQRLGPISKRGDRYLRRILVVGAVAVLRYARQNPEKYPWLTRLLARKPFKVAAVALANKTARIAWALLAKGWHLSGTCACGSGLKRSVDGKISCVCAFTNCRGDDGIDANGRDRRLGEPEMGHAILERARLFGAQSADYITASGHSGRIAIEARLQAKTDPMKVARTD
jgi:transposase